MGYRLGTRRLVALAAVGVLGALSLSACGSDSDDSGGDSGGDAAKKVGVILPDAATSPRWEANDRPSLQKAFDDAGIESIIKNADGDVAKFGNICDDMINQGVSRPDDRQPRLRVGRRLPQEGRRTPASRASTTTGSPWAAARPTTCPSTTSQVGELMGEGLTKCLDDAGTTKANIVFINGDPTDNNAALFKEGYETNLQPKIDSGDYKLVGDQTGEWDATVAGTAFEQLYAKNDGKVDGVVSANDTMAGGIVARLKANGLAGKVPVTGQDASVEGLQRVLAGTQCMTVYKDTNLEAEGCLRPRHRADQRRPGDGRRPGHRRGRGHRARQGRPVRAGHARGHLHGRRRQGDLGRVPDCRGRLHRGLRQALRRQRRPVTLA